MNPNDWTYVACKMLSHDRMFWVHRKHPNQVKLHLKGAYPLNTPSGQDARPTLFEEIIEDEALYRIMGEKNRTRSQSIARLCKDAIANQRS